MAPRTINRIDNDTVEITLRGRDVQLRIPPKYREDWDPDDEMEGVDVNFGLQWVYGYRGAEDSGDNMHVLNTGEIVYYIASVVVLYNPDAHVIFNS